MLRVLAVAMLPLALARAEPVTTHPAGFAGSVRHPRAGAADAGQGQAFRITASRTGTANRLTLFVAKGSSARSVQLGLYRDRRGRPGARMARCTITRPRAQAWNRCAIRPVGVTRKRVYWTALLVPRGSSGRLRFGNHRGGDARTSATARHGSLPSRWGAAPRATPHVAALYADRGPRPSATPPAGAPNVTPSTLPHDPSFVGPAYYAAWPNGPSTSMDSFPILAYHMNLAQWSQLPGRLKAAHVNGVYMAYDQSSNASFNVAAANRLTIFISSEGNDIAKVRSSARVATAYAMQDEPNQDGSPYAASAGSPANDVGASRYAADADAQRAADPTRPVVGNFTKDVEDWGSPPSGWSTAAFAAHNRAMLRSLDITSGDVYGWTDNWEWDQGSGNAGTRHIGAWVYGHEIGRLRAYNPGAPAYGFVECCDSGDSPPSNTMTPGMIETAVWNLLVHGARGWTYWPRDFYHADDQPYPGAGYNGEYSLFGDHQWDAQYNRVVEVDGEVESYAHQLNSPTVARITATGQDGVPVAAMGKDDGGRLWLLAQADGDEGHPLSNLAPMTGTITLPSAIPAGTVFTVAGENRTVTVNAAHQIVDTFRTTTETPAYSGKPLTYGYAHHIYVQAG